MEDWLRSKGVWYWLKASDPVESVDAKGYRKCMEARDQAVGEIRRFISPELRSTATSESEPLKILLALKTAYGTLTFATHFNAMQALLAVCQEASELSASFISQARDALRILQASRPALATLVAPATGTAVGYSLLESDTELLISVLLTGTA